MATQYHYRKNQKQATEKIKTIQEYIKAKFNSEIMLCCENHDSEIERELDQHGGTDWILTDKDTKRIFQLAARASTYAGYMTFTVRQERESGKPTEYEKFQAIVKGDCAGASHVCQAYWDDAGMFRCAAICRVSDLIEMINCGECGINETKEKGQADFFYVHFKDFEKHKKNIKFISPKDVAKS